MWSTYNKNGSYLFTREEWKRKVQKDDFVEYDFMSSRKRFIKMRKLKLYKVKAKFNDYHNAKNTCRYVR